jgi:hypothetical protein
MARFVRAGRDALSAEPFLDPKWDCAGLPRAEIAWTALPALRERPRLGFVWHTSFCCSTLIAGLLDQPGRCLALKEPRVLVDLADLKRRGELYRSPELSARILALLARRFAPGEQVLVKPSNGANALILAAAAESDGPVLLLHSSCADFIVSVAMGGETLRAYVRALLLSLAADQPHGRGPAASDLARLTDLQTAALAWQLQMAGLGRAAQALGGRCRSLDSAAFRADPHGAVAALDRHFAVGLDRGRAMAALARDAKSGEAFDPAARAERARAAVAGLGADLDGLVAWSFRTCGWAEAGAALPDPLIG